MTATAPKTPAYRTLTLARATERGMHPVQLTAAELWELIEETGKETVRLYESFGHVGGQLMFGTHTFRNNRELGGVETLDSTGRVICRYPVEAGPGRAAPSLILFRRPEILS